MKNNTRPYRIGLPRKYMILDWAGNDVFNGESFRTIEAAADYLEEQVKRIYPETQTNEDKFYEQMNEYQIITKEEEN